jgi:hypothetical protein
MDIGNIKPIERTIEIAHPGTGGPLGVRVRVMSIEDERLKKIKREITDDRFKLESKNKSLKTEDVERNGNRLLFSATLGWEWYNPTGEEGDEGYDADAMPTFNGEVPDYNQKNFMAVIRELPWFADQIREEIDETKAFFNNSKSN